MQYDDTNRGAFFKNERKENENQPDYKGPLNVEGKDYEIAGWIKKSKTGKTYLSLKVQEPFEKRADRAQSAPPRDDFEDQNIPI